MEPFFISYTLHDRVQTEVIPAANGKAAQTADTATVETIIKFLLDLSVQHGSGLCF